MSSDLTGKSSKTKKIPKSMNGKMANVVDLDKSIGNHTTVDVREDDKMMDRKLENVDDLEKTVTREMHEPEQALNQELLKSAARKKKSTKRAGEPMLHVQSQKIRKLLKEEATNVNVNIEEASATLIQELERALDRNDDDAHVTSVIREVAKTPDLPPHLTMRLLKFCVKVGDRDVARQLLDNQTVDVDTREGGELLWTAVEKDRDEIAAMLVRRGADLSVRKFSDDRTILHHMLNDMRIGLYVERRDLFSLMLELGADVDARDNKGRSVLHNAIVNSYQTRRPLEELLKHGARVTVDRVGGRLDDVSLAFKTRVDLLPILVQASPDEETRNERAVVAIQRLITKDFAGEGEDKAEGLQMIKGFLDMGVPVNVSTNLPDSILGELGYSFLDKALIYKNKEAVKLLLECGADPHQKGMLGHTPLYRATTFKGYTHVSRWLIEKGASIHERNVDGEYPIHGACKNLSLRNLHLFLNLGADLNVTDNKGKTPFDLMGMRETLKCKESHHLVIKHFALMIAQGGQIGDRDMDRVNQCDWSRRHFEKCSGQLEKMKEEKVHGDISYFSLLSKNTYCKVQLMKNKHFLGKFKRDEKRRAELFPDYFYMIIHSAEIAEKKLEMLLAEKEQLREAFPETMPEHIVEKIAYYFGFEKLERCQRDYYLSFHANLKYNQAGKAKIL